MVAQKFLESTDPGAFQDWVKNKPSLVYTKECPVCQGYGGWNLTVNAYGPGRHFKCVCSTCNGYGYVHPDMKCTGHVWTFVENLGRCYNRYKCTKCDIFQDVDSTD